MNKLTLEQLLRMKIAGTSPVTGKAIQYPPEFRVAVQNETEDGVHIIVHANGHNSETLDFIVKGNELIDYNDYQWWTDVSQEAKDTFDCLKTLKNKRHNNMDMYLRTIQLHETEIDQIIAVLENSVETQEKSSYDVLP